MGVTFRKNYVMHPTIRIWAIVGQHGQALLYTSGELSQRACAPFTLACHIGVVIPCSKEGPLFMTTALLGEPMVDVLRR
jgi:hypothetical protein